MNGTRAAGRRMKTVDRSGRTTNRGHQPHRHQGGLLTEVSGDISGHVNCAIKSKYVKSDTSAMS